jgi:hypothetical protein
LSHAHSHKEVISRVREELDEVFEESEQGVYVYLDDSSKVCNNKFAKMLGYKTPEEWAKVMDNFPEVFVAPKDRRLLVETFQKAMNSLVGSMVSITWKKKGGGEAPSKTILVPIVKDGHRMALHFVSEA